jgi:prepilin-type N-terminal cleavage/methylation domain-containing protein
MREHGYTFIEVLVVVAVLGVFLVVAFPNIKNSLEVRNLENQARSILGTFQQAKFQAVRNKLNFRVHFDNSLGYWTYYVEQEVNYLVWQAVPGTGRKSISQKFTTTVNLPSNIIEFSPLGMANNYSTTLHDVTIQSPVLAVQGKPSRRIINVFAGGSIQFVKAT